MSSNVRQELPPATTEGLSKRELEVLDLAGRMSNAQIAARLGISPGTVKLHLARARGKYRDLDGIDGCGK